MKLPLPLRAVYVCLIALALAIAASAGGTGSGGGGNPPAVFIPTSFSANATVVGQSSTAPVTLANLASSSPLTISTISVGGANTGDFSLDGTCANGVSIPKRTGCTIQITFTPSAVGPRAASITATFSNAPTVTLPLAGNGLAATPGLSTFSGAITFVDAEVGSTSTPHTLTVTNSGGANLTLSSFSFGGFNAGDFVIVSANHGISNCFQGIVLAPLSTCYIGLNFSPTDVGPRLGTFSLLSDDPADPNHSIDLSGTGLAAPPPPPPPQVISAFNVGDLWVNAAEPGWTLSIIHHKGTTATDAVIATWSTFDASSAPTWFSLEDGAWSDSQTYKGNLHQKNGSDFAGPFTASASQDLVVGTATLNFTDTNNGTFSYTITASGVTGTKTITRKSF